MKHRATTSFDNMRVEEDSVIGLVGVGVGVRTDGVFGGGGGGTEDGETVGAEVKT